MSCTSCKIGATPCTSSSCLTKPNAYSTTLTSTIRESVRKSNLLWKASHHALRAWTYTKVDCSTAYLNDRHSLLVRSNLSTPVYITVDPSVEFSSAGIFTAICVRKSAPSMCTVPMSLSSQRYTECACATTTFAPTRKPGMYSLDSLKGTCVNVRFTTSSKTTIPRSECTPVTSAS